MDLAQQLQEEKDKNAALEAALKMAGETIARLEKNASKSRDISSVAVSTEPKQLTVGFFERQGKRYQTLYPMFIIDGVCIVASEVENDSEIWDVVLKDYNYIVKPV